MELSRLGVTASSWMGSPERPESMGKCLMLRLNDAWSDTFLKYKSGYSADSHSSVRSAASTRWLSTDRLRWTFGESNPPAEGKPSGWPVLPGSRSSTYLQPLIRWRTATD